MTSKAFLAGFREPQDEASRMVEGRGAWLRDSHGHEFLDFSSQYWNVNLGHRHPGLIARLHKALDNSLFINLRFGNTEAPEILARCLLALAGNRFHAVQFMTSGSMAVEAAIKVAREVTGRQEVLSFHRSYHGMSLGALAATGYDELVLQFGPRDPRHLLAPAFDAAAVEELLRSRASTLAAVLAEPVVSNQVVVPPADFWRAISAACRRLGVLLIADEVVCGMGRCGDWFGHSRVGMEPDLVALGKGLSAGAIPMAALLHGHRTASFYQARTLLHGQTFDGFDLGCRSALAVLDVIEQEHLLNRVRELEQFLPTHLQELTAALPPGAVREWRGWGALWGLEVSAACVAEPLLHPFAIRLQQVLQDHGLLLGGLGRVLIFAPPFIISAEELREGFHRVERALRKVLEERSWVQ